jgi:hypothetical protein
MLLVFSKLNFVLRQLKPAVGNLLLKVVREILGSLPHLDKGAFEPTCQPAE